MASSLYLKFLHAGATTAAVIVAFLLRQILVWNLGFHLGPFVTYYSAIMVIALVFGLRAGLAATLLAALLDVYWVLPPIKKFSVAKEDDVVELVLFIATGIFMSAVSDRYVRERKILDTALASMQDALFIYDAKGKLIKFNQSFIRLLKCRSTNDCPRTREELHAIFDLCDLDGRAMPLDQWPSARALRGEIGIEEECVLRRKGNTESCFGSYSFNPFYAQDGMIAGAVVSARDISERKQRDIALRASEARYRSVFDTNLDGLAILRMDNGRFIDVNQTFIGFSGYSREEILGKTCVELDIWENHEDRERLFKTLAEDGICWDWHAQLKQKNGHIFWGSISSSIVEIAGKPCFLIAVRDISEVRKAKEDILYLSLFDPLTGLANRRELMEQLRGYTASSASRRHPGAMLFIDLDNFKTLNDTHGHQIGDLLLQEVARRLGACVREGDTVARLGGDEFVVILKELSTAPEDATSEAKTVAEKILASVDRPYLLNAKECNSTCSIGVALMENDQKNESDFLQRAEIAMFQAKAKGGNVVHVFVPSMQAAVNARVEMEEALREGIKTNQFMLYYQPQVEHGKVIGAEVLVRWNHPTLGVLAPGEFISLAEETKLILPLGDWILKTACRQIAAWTQNEQTAHLKIAVNISGAQLLKDDFVQTVLAALDHAGAHPTNLDLELTESMLVDNVEDVIAKMTALKSHGVSFSVDDFGTGYSSLAYLKRFPLDVLKIDRIFIRDILTDAASGAIANTIISLGKTMGLSVIAEGVEAEEQLNYLANLGCHCYQGYLFSRPLPLEDFELFLSSANKNDDANFS